jgi:hypothetical protein
MQLNRLLIFVACGVFLMSAGCFSRGEESSQSDGEANTASQVTNVQPADDAPAAGASAPSQASGVDASPGVAQTVENVAAINSYRLRISTSSESARGVDEVLIEGAYVKEPAAEQLVIDFQQGGQTQRMEMIVVDGVRYMHTGDIWMQTPEAMINLDELTLITPEDVAGLLERMERVGVETLNNREAVHYRGGQDLIPVVGTESDTLDVSQVEFAQLDLWIDQIENVVSRLALEARDNSAEQQFTASVVFEYYDFNANIVIDAPSTAAGAPAGVVESAPAVAAPTTELGQLVGFNLLLPTGSNIETIVSGSVLVATTPYTFEEAENFIEQALQNNGYTLATKVGPLDNQIVYMFQKGAKLVNITVSIEGDGGVKLQFASAP